MGTFEDYILTSPVQPHTYGYVEALKAWNHQQTKITELEKKLEKAKELVAEHYRETPIGHNFYLLEKFKELTKRR